MKVRPETLDAVMRIEYARKLIEVIDLVIRGWSVREASREVRVPYSTAGLWVRRAGLSKPCGRPKRAPEVEEMAEAEGRQVVPPGRRKPTLRRVHQGPPDLSDRYRERGG